jgi:hypothetical protein
MDFMQKQCNIEIQKGRFSDSFGTSLLPGMFSAPTFAVPKEGSSKLRLVTDQSAGTYSVNDMCSCHEHAFPLDNMTHLGEQILKAYNELTPDEHLVVYKSDVAEAYRLIPMHPIWQTKQINTVDGQRYVDRNNVFGGRRSGDIFIAVMAGVMWIMENIWKVWRPNAFVDDVFGVEKSSRWQKYGPYQRVFPTSQTQTLNCWDRLGILHKPEKQLYRTKLTIIGIHVLRP